MPRTLGQALAFLLGLALVLWLAPFPSAAEGGAGGIAPLESAVHASVEALRRQRGLLPLPRSSGLDRVARAHSLDMAQRGYLSHQTPEGQGPVERLHGAGIEGFRLAAENIGQSSAGDPVLAIVSGWQASPSHRENLYAPPWNATGIGAARARDGSLIVTQVFATFPR